MLTRRLGPERGHATDTLARPITPVGRAFAAASGAAPKEQPPRNLSGKRTARGGNAGKQPARLGRVRLADGESHTRWRSSQAPRQRGDEIHARALPEVSMTSRPTLAELQGDD